MKCIDCPDGTLTNDQRGQPLSAEDLRLLRQPSKVSYRLLKVEEFWTPRFQVGCSSSSLIRLKGKWLAEAGFTPGQQAEVKVEPGRIVLRVAGQRE